MVTEHFIPNMVHNMKRFITTMILYPRDKTILFIMSVKGGEKTHSHINSIFSTIFSL